MKRLIILLSTAFLFFIFTTSSCKKHKNEPIVDKGCGCSTENTIYNLNSSQGLLGFDQFYQKWKIVQRFPNNAFWVNVICNSENSQVRNITNSLSINDTITVKFSGRLTDFCSDDPTPIYQGIVVPYHLTIDSLKRN